MMKSQKRKTIIKPYSLKEEFKSVAQLCEEHRFGSIILTRDLIMKCSLVNVNAFMSIFVILGANYDIVRERFKYEGVSEYFRPLNEGEEVPTYNVDIQVVQLEDGSEKLTITCEEV